MTPATTAKPAPMPLLSAKEVAQRLNLSLRTVRRLIASGALATIRIGSSVRISEADLQAFVAASARR